MGGDASARTALITAASDWQRAAAARVLRPHAAVVMGATSEAALDVVREYAARPPGSDAAPLRAVLIDLGMPRTGRITGLAALDMICNAHSGAIIVACGGRDEVASAARRAGIRWAADAHEAAMRIARWWRIPASVPRAQAIVAELLGSEIGTTLKQMPVLALTVAGLSASAIAAELGITVDTVKGYRRRIAHRAGQTSLGPLVQRAQLRAMGEPVELLRADWLSARKCLKREREELPSARLAKLWTIVKTRLHRRSWDLFDAR